ncbi:hypothetical protein Q8G32_28755 [Priestia megaterium]|uniref:hypothetical protein n=1 Tax=Priestia megaterium TaxID=1404 RepID=UPI0027317901|nr:hypothetical protein [Priestia megaterium]MDP1471833.1 hypothetical protein [Priestia megaterium]
MTTEEKIEKFSKRALDLALEQINTHIREVDNQMFQDYAKVIILTTTAITAQLIVEYDENKEKELIE